MQYNIKPPIEELLGEWIDVEKYTNTGLFLCSICDIFWLSDKATFYYYEKCPNNNCKILCNSIYIYYSNTKLSNDVIIKCPIKFIQSNLNNDILIIHNNITTRCDIKLNLNNYKNGIWIISNNYKSFGIYECKCKQIWMSAYANTKYKQKCEKCYIEYFPKFIWINHTNNKTNNKHHVKKHLYELCEGCKNNDCHYIN